jgi:hypothetical protein
VGKREALMRGFYGRQVKRLVDASGRERLLVLQYERCVRAPADELARTLEFVGVSPWRPDDRLLTTRYNQTVGEKSELSAKEEAMLVAEYEPVRTQGAGVEHRSLAWLRFAHRDRVT